MLSVPIRITSTHPDAWQKPPAQTNPALQSLLPLGHFGPALQVLSLQQYLPPTHSFVVDEAAHLQALPRAVKSFVVQGVAFLQIAVVWPLVPVEHDPSCVLKCRALL